MPSHISENLTGHVLLQQKMLLQLQATVTSQQAELTQYKHENQKLREALEASERKLQAHQHMLEVLTCTGTLPFEFTIPNFNQHKQVNDEWYSPHFYTHTHGYRMCIKVFANGFDQFKGKSVSVFSFLMRGDFDDDLQWPFQGTITIQLLNQLEDANHHMRVLSFTYSDDFVGLQRVTSGERAPRACGGMHAFISHAQLSIDADRNTKYLQNNQLKFRVLSSKATDFDLTACIHTYRRCLALECFAGAIEPQVCVAPIEFPLSDFERQKKQNDWSHSPAFYTHPRGYRMCLRVHPNGNGDGLGTHVSIFTCIMRGPFDADLKWPFRGDITIQIVNQAGEDNHQERVIHYTDQTSDDTAGRVTDREISDGLGFHKFLPHSSLGYKAASSTQYLRGDSFQIRISKVKLKN